MKELRAEEVQRAERIIAEEPRPAPRRRRAAKQAEPAARSKITVDLPAELAREIRAACLELPPRVTGGGLSSFVANALQVQVEKLRRQHNGGERFEAGSAPRLAPGPRTGG